MKEKQKYVIKTPRNKEEDKFNLSDFEFELDPVIAADLARYEEEQEKGLLKGSESEKLL